MTDSDRERREGKWSEEERRRVSEMRKKRRGDEVNGSTSL